MAIAKESFTIQQHTSNTIAHIITQTHAQSVYRVLIRSNSLVYTHKQTYIYFIHGRGCVETSHVCSTCHLVESCEFLESHVYQESRNGQEIWRTYARYACRVFCVGVGRDVSEARVCYVCDALGNSCCFYLLFMVKYRFCLL